jgi:hypothetical protein
MLLSINNLSSCHATECEPWNITTHAPRKPNWNKPDVEHCFYSGLEGLIAAARIDSKNNPAVFLHWLVADYDGQIDQHMRNTVVERCGDFRPQHICRTFSGGARLLWKLEQPFPLHNNDLTAKLLSHIKRTLKLKKLLVGLDEDAFEDPCKYYEAGTDWEKISDDVIPASFMMHWAIEATRNYDWGKLAPAIPMEKIAEEVERQYPGGWQGEFEIGARGVRFWDSSADNDTAAIIRESGMQCFTGGQAFVPWSAILGGKFVRKFEADRVGGAIENIWFDGRDYWHRHPDGTWNSLGKYDTGLELKVAKGLRMTKPRNANFSEIDKALQHIHKYQRITCAAPLIHRPKGIVQVNGLRILNTSTVSVMQPADVIDSFGRDGSPSRPSESASQGGAGSPRTPHPCDADTPVCDFESAPSPVAEGRDLGLPSNLCPLTSDLCRFPWLHGYFSTLFDPAEQLDYFFAWLQRWYKSALENYMLPGQAAFFAGPPNTGKTLLSTLVLSRIFGGHTDASSFLSGDDNFNSHLFQSAVWAVDDVVPLTDRKSHMKFSALIKKMAANRTFSIREKFKIDKTIEWNGRVVVTCNTDPESIRILPDVDLSNRDKINLFKVAERDDFTFPIDVADTIQSELPYFLRWLLDWTPPAHVIGGSRYGVETYCEDTLFDDARHSSNSYSFLEVLLQFFEGQVEDVWTGNATGLLTAMNADQDGLACIVSKYTTNQVGRELSKLASQGYAITQRRCHATRIWDIDIARIREGTR